MALRKLRQRLAMIPRRTLSRGKLTVQGKSGSDGQSNRSADAEATRLSLLEQTQAYLQALIEDRAPGSMLSQAWQEFYRIYSRVIRRYVISHGIQGADADDCVQEVWMAVARKLTEFEHPRNRPGLRSWLYTVVRSKTTNVIRRNNRRTIHNLDAFIEEVTDLASVEPEPAEATEWQWEATMVMTAMEELRRRVPEINYRVLEMRIVEGRSEADTATALGLTPEQVRYRKHRTKRKLESMLDTYTGKRFE